MQTVQSILVAAVLALASFTSGPALAATGGLPGSGDWSFSPGGHASNNHCITPAGTDANELLGVAEQIVIFDAPEESGCASVSAGEFWIPLGNAMWITNTSFEAVPSGYEPAAATPMEDFLAKAQAITYIIDPGSAHERTYRYPVRDVVKVGTIDQFFAPSWSPPPYPVAQFAAKLPPLSPGEHTYTAVLEMSARSCDGLGTEEFNCVGPGATTLCTLPVTVEQRTAAPNGSKP